MKLNKFDSSEDLGKALADAVTASISEPMKEIGNASIVVSGGTTPAPFFQAMKEKEIEREKLWVTLTDERWVDVTSDASNEKLVRENFLIDKEHFVSLKNASATSAEGQAEIEKTLQEIPKPFDAVIIGMGEDGHIASLFADSENIKEAMDANNTALCIATKTSTAPNERISLTLSALLNSREIILYVTGKEKLKIIEQAITKPDYEKLPVSAILHQNKTPVSIYWAP